MKKVSAIAICFLVILSIINSRVFAQSEYVLPYPDIMPGGVFYKIDKIGEDMQRYWYFGDFGQFKYNLKLADKNLVEAKVLFEYKQYLLAYNALLKSDFYFRQLKGNLVQAQLHKKDTSLNREILKSASEKHKEQLNNLLKSVPSIFIWNTENKPPVNLELHRSLNDSINVRNEI